MRASLLKWVWFACTLVTQVSLLAQVAPSVGLKGVGLSDLFWRNATTGQVYQMPVHGATVGPGAVVWTEPSLAWQIAGIADFDGDARPDLLWWNNTTGQVYLMLLENQSVKSGSLVYTEPDTEWMIQGVADFNGDGKADLLWRHGSSGQVYLMPMDGGTPLPGAIVWTEPSHAWHIVAMDDFSGDGKADILWWNRNSGQVYLLAMNGTQVLSTALVYTESDTNWQISGSGDFDGDGTSDLLWTHVTRGQRYVMPFRNGLPQAGAVVWTEPDPAWQVVAIGDLDGDQRADLVWWNCTTGMVYQMQMDGFTIKSEAMLYVEPDTAWSIQSRGRRSLAEPAGVSLVAGWPGSPGHRNGWRQDARFLAVTDLAMANGELLVADDHMVRKIGRDGVVMDVAGKPRTIGTSNGPGSQALFWGPLSLTSDPWGNIFVCEQGKHTVRRISPDGQVSLYAGAPGEVLSLDGERLSARFDSPFAICCDSAGNLFIAEAYAIRKITPAGMVSTLATGFYWPQGIALDRNENLLVADTQSHSIKAVSQAGVVTTICGNGAGLVNGSVDVAKFNLPWDVAMDAMGNLFVSDLGNQLIRKISPEGVVTTFAGVPGAVYAQDGPAHQASFSDPRGLCFAPSGMLLVGDGTGTGRTVRSVAPDGTVSTFAGVTIQYGYVNGLRDAARFGSPGGVARDSKGNVYVTDQGTIRRITPGGEVTTYAGVPGQPGFVDGPLSSARFSGPCGLAMHPDGSLYLTDGHAIRKITPEGIVSTIAGQPGLSGYENGPGPSARFSSPLGLAFDPAGNLLVVDRDNFCVRSISPDGTVSLFAGTPGQKGHYWGGHRLETFFYYPQWIAVSGTGNVYITETAAVTRIGLDDRTAMVASLGDPNGICVDREENLYVAERASYVVWRIANSGGMRAMVGDPLLFGNATGPLRASPSSPLPMNPGSVFEPYGVCATPNGEILVTCFSCVLKITSADIQ